MSGYVEAGYVVAFATLGGYALSLVVRERSVRRRLAAAATAAEARSAGLQPPSPGPAPAGGGAVPGAEPTDS